MRRREALKLLAGSFAGLAASTEILASPAKPLVLNGELIEKYVEYFNGMVPEEVVNFVPNARASEWMKENIPYFTCPDKNIEETYYYRWWTYRKHIKQTPKGFIVTEFLKPVKHATEFNVISCAFGHHSSEGRWLHNPEYLNGYTAFWLRSGPDGGLQSRFHQFSGWAASAIYDRWLVNGDSDYLASLIDSLILDYRTWEHDRQRPDGLFWQSDVADGMEESVSGGRKVRNVRPTINSYMYGNAKALEQIAKLAPGRIPAAEYARKAAELKRLLQDRLWDQNAGFFETLLDSGTLTHVREEIGFTPWYFELPDHQKGYEVAWKQLMDPQGFCAPYGPTTAEQRDPRFRIAYRGDDCQWNGPSWPFGTSITLRALANVLNGYEQNSISKDDYLATLLIYTHSHSLMLPDGRRIPWIDEDLNPFTGEWLARQRKIDSGTFYGRGDHYNHSTYADLIITGLVGLRPRADEVVEVNPLLPSNKWDWFCLDNVLYRGRLITILWDKSGNKFGKGIGLRVFADGREIAQGADLGRVSGPLNG